MTHRRLAHYSLRLIETLLRLVLTKLLIEVDIAISNGIIILIKSCTELICEVIVIKIIITNTISNATNFIQHDRKLIQHRDHNGILFKNIFRNTLISFDILNCILYNFICITQFISIEFVRIKYCTTDRAFSSTIRHQLQYNFMICTHRITMIAFCCNCIVLSNCVGLSFLTYEFLIFFFTQRSFSGRHVCRHLTITITHGSTISHRCTITKLVVVRRLRLLLVEKRLIVVVHFVHVKCLLKIIF